MGTTESHVSGLPMGEARGKSQARETKPSQTGYISSYLGEQLSRHDPLVEKLLSWPKSLKKQQRAKEHATNNETTIRTLVPLRATGPLLLFSLFQTPKPPKRPDTNET